MGAAATLSESVLTVEPGSEVTCTIVVRNTGTVVDQFSFEVIGDAADWATIDPETISLFPGAEETVAIRFHPPRSSKIRAGTVPFAVKVLPKEEPEGSTAEEGTVEIAPFIDTTAELLPRTSRGRRRGIHELAVDNRGNARVNAKLSAADADALLTYKIDPPAIVIEPGQATFAKVVAAPKKRFWRGPPVTHIFQVLVEPEAGVPLAVDGTMLQEARLPKWLPRAIIALLVLLGLLAALWLTLLRPTLESAARAAAEEEVAAVKEEQAAIAEQAAAAEEKATAADEKATVADEKATAADEKAVAVEENVTATDEERRTRELGDAFDRRLARSVVAGGEATESFVVPDETRLSLTDIVLQNPQADSGIMQVRRRAGDSTAVLLEVRLENFRDLDYHFVSPMRFEAGEAVNLFIRCENVEERACNASALFTGFLKDLSQPAPAEEPADAEADA